MVKNPSVMDASSRNEKRLARKTLAAKIAAQCAIWLVLILLYVPILTLIVYSFTTSTNLGTWMGFSFRLYSDLFHDAEIMAALGNTIILAVASSVCSVVLGSISSGTPKYRASLALFMPQWVRNASAFSSTPI